MPTRPVLMELVALEDVTTVLGRMAVTEPVDHVRELADPDTIRLDQAIRRVLAASADTRTVVADPTVTYFGAAVDDTSLGPGHDSTLTTPEIAPTTLDAWLATS